MSRENSSGNIAYYASSPPTSASVAATSSSSSPISIPSNGSHLDYREINFEEIKLDDMPIGSGAFGIVHKGTWRGATVAVKKLLVTMEEEQLRMEIRREACVIQRVANHPNIVRFYGACTKKNPYCLVVSLYPRGSVHSLLRSKANLQWRTIVGFAKDAAAGILHLHCENVIHRDIAARNLLVDENWTVRITDFGLARLKVSATSHTKSNVGPVKWMAPEALKLKQYSVKSDSYSFGILLWELLTKKEPYQDTDTIHVALSVIEGMRPPIPDDAPPFYANLMRRCWHQDPEQRPDFYEIFEELQKFHDSLPAVTDPVLLTSLSSSQFLLAPVGSPSMSSGSSAGLRDLECPICGEIFETVVETPCCHACYCLSCITDWGNKAGSCPECRSILRINELRPNVPLQRLVDNLPAECPNASKGCTDRITRGILNDHLLKCEYITIECGNYDACITEGLQLPPNSNPCGRYLKKDIYSHKRNLCPYRFIDCPHGCGAHIRIFVTEAHGLVCPRVIVDCPNGCDIVDLRRSDVSSHCENVCPLQPTVCKYKKWGCNSVIPRRDVDSHNRNDAMSHTQLAEEYVARRKAKTKQQREGLYQKCARLAQDVTKLRLSVEELSLLKPHLPHHPLFSHPLILPYCIVMPANQEAATMLFIESDSRTITYQPAVQKFFSTKPIQLSKAVTIISDRPVPAIGDGLIYYFEISVKNPGKDGAIGLGLCAPQADCMAMPGWYPHTYGYHGDDGRKFGAPNHKFGMTYGSTWGKDDIVGCGWDQTSQRVFYTVNGKFQGVAFENVSGQFYPAIGLHTPNARVKVNFGQEPFLFDTTNFVLPPP